MGAGLSRPLPVRRNERLSRFSSIRIGGPVEAVVFVSSSADIEELFEMESAGEIPGPLRFVGRGSNILFPDRGLDGTLVRFGSETAPVWEEDGQVRVVSGYSLPALARDAASRGVAGFEFLAGIPGTVGGATVMNAGAGGHAWSDLCRSVTLMTRAGRIVRLPADRMCYGYRSSILCAGRVADSGPEGDDLAGAIVLEACLSGGRAPVSRCREILSEHLHYRKTTQPLDLPSLGSVFRNPGGERGAGRLLEETGLKGERRGAIMVSPRHANFFVNTGEGKAAEFMDLMWLVADRVKEKWGILLEPEVKIWNA